LPKQADANVVKLFSSKDGIIAVTSNGVFRNRNGKWDGIPFGCGWITATLDTKGEVWLASVHQFKKKAIQRKLKCRVTLRKIHFMHVVGR